MESATRQTWEEIADGVVSEVFGGMSLSSDERRAIDGAIREIAAVNGEHTRSGLVNVALKIRSLM